MPFVSLHIPSYSKVLTPDRFKMYSCLVYHVFGFHDVPFSNRSTLFLQNRESFLVLGSRSTVRMCVIVHPETVQRAVEFVFKTRDVFPQRQSRITIKCTIP